MKKLIIITALTIFTMAATTAQTVNWEALPTKGHILSAHVGWDYSFNWGIGYGYKLDAKLPIILKGDFSMPSGEKALDDFNIKLGAQIRWFQRGSFMFSTEVDGIFRRFENSHTRMLNFGSFMSGVVGYYKPRWMVAGEFGFDKAIVTHFKHSSVMKEFFPQVKDGWYEPATGGNFHYGIQAGYSFAKSDVGVKFGKVVEQDFKNDPTIPFYFQLSYNLRLQR